MGSMTRWEWLIYCLAQTAIIVGLLAIAALIGFSIWAVLALIAAAFFVWRSFNHPDFWLRRLSLFFASLGGTYLFVGNIIRLPQEVVWNWVVVVVNFLNTLSRDYWWGGVICVILSVVFAVLELVRQWLSTRQGITANRLILHTKDVQEDIPEKAAPITLSVNAVLQNPSDKPVILVRPQLTRLTLWPRTLPAIVYKMERATKILVGNTLEVSAGKVTQLRFEAAFNTKTRFGQYVNSLVLYRIIFGRRRISFSMKAADGNTLLLLETARLSS